MGHVVHKHLVADLLAHGDAHQRFLQKTSQYDAALDHEDGGGVNINNFLEREDEEANAVNHPAIQPEYLHKDVPQIGDWPDLARSRSVSKSTTLASDMDRMSLGSLESSTLVGSNSHTMDGSAAPSSKQYVQISYLVQKTCLHLAANRKRGVDV